MVGNGIIIHYQSGSLKKGRGQLAGNTEETATSMGIHGDPWGAMSHTSLRPMEGIPLHTQICPFYYDQTWDHGSPIGGFMNDGWGVAP